MTAKDVSDDDRGTDDKQLVEIPVEPPRDPAAYRPRDHFIQRLRERVPEFARDLPRDVIQDGRVCRVHGDTVADSPDYGTPVAFTHTVRGDTWTVVVALRPDGFADDGADHYALTLWQGEPAMAGQQGGNA
jgi:hypothetical protein